jgi:hypothetical protein
VPEDAAFVQFVARRYHHLAAYRSVVLGIGVLTAAPLLTMPVWNSRAWTLVAVIIGVLIACKSALAATTRANSESSRGGMLTNGSPGT